MIRYTFYALCFIFLFSCKGSKDEMPLPDLETETETETETEPEVENEVVFQWQTVTATNDSKPVQRHEAAFVRLGEKFYLLGGRDIRSVSIFDQQTGTWSTGAEPPIELHHFQPVVIENKIYVIGAFTGLWPNETPTANIYIYDPSIDTWSMGDEIPAERRRGSTGNILHNGKVFVACGIKNGHIGDHKNWMDLYDPIAGTWQILADAPRARDHFQAVLVDGKIVAPAGRNTGIVPEEPFGGTIAEVDVYDIANDTWQTLPNNIPTQRAGNAAILFNGEVLVVGGESTTQEKAHDEVEALDLTTNEWKALPALLEGRHGTGLLEYQDALYIASGCGNRGGTPELFSMEKFAE